MSATAPTEQTVVVGVDGSDGALGAAQWAADLAAKWALPLTLLHAVPRLEWHFSTTPAPPLDTTSDVLAVAQAAVQSHNPNLAILAVSVKDSVAAALTQASAAARLLVVVRARRITARSADTSCASRTGRSAPSPCGGNPLPSGPESRCPSWSASTSPTTHRVRSRRRSTSRVRCTHRS